MRVAVRVKSVHEDGTRLSRPSLDDDLTVHGRVNFCWQVSGWKY